MNMYRDRVVSYDFSDAFEMESMNMVLDTLRVSEDRGIDRISQIFGMYRKNLEFFDYDLPETAASMKMDRNEAHTIMVNVAKRVLGISEDDISELGEELSKVYPLPIAVYYEECVHAMQKFIEKVA